MLRLALTMLAGLAGPAAGLVQAPDVGSRFGVYRDALEELREPTRAAVAADGSVLVVETSAACLSRFSADGELLARFGSRGGGPGELDAPRGVALSDDGLAWVADSGNHRIVVLSPDGAPVRAFGGFGTAVGELARPEDVAVSEDAVWVSDSGNHRIQRFDRDGRPRGAFGGFGRGDGELRAPLGLAVDADGRVLVADSGNHRVAVFGPDGAFRFAFGHRGSDPGLFSSPSDVAARGGRIYVADRGNHRIQVFDADGGPLYEWGIHALRPREGEGRLHYPSGVALDPSGERAVVCEGFSDRVQRFGPAEGPAELYMTDPAILPQGPARHYGMSIDAGGDVLLVAEPETETVLVFALVDPTPILIARLGGHGSAADDLVQVADVAVSDDGREVTVTDAGSRRLSTFRLDRDPGERARFDPTLGRFVRSADLELLRARRPGFERLAGPLEPGPVERAPDGDLFVVDVLRARVLRLSPSFDLRGVLGGRDAGPGALRGPSDLELSRDGRRLLVVDAEAARVVELDLAGRFVRAFGEGLVLPHGIALDEDGSAFVTDVATHRVRVFGPDGEPASSFGGEGLGAGQLFKPRGIAVDARGRVIVLDHGNHRGQVFTRDGEFLSAFGSRLYVLETRRSR